MPAALERARWKQLKRIEWPTVLLAIVIYGAFAALTWFHASLPVWALVALGGYVVAWHGSLQHETIHAHPTRSRRFNALVGGWPLTLWLPYDIYRREHLQHHGSAELTQPERDPESYFVSAAKYAAAGRVRRSLWQLRQTLLGRLLVGPPLAVASLVGGEWARWRRGEGAQMRRDWGTHAALATPVLLWIVGVCGMSLGKYVLCFVYPGMALTALRAFAEHAPAPSQPERTAIVESNMPMGLLYLFNNLHVVHHEQPGLPWYRIPRVYQAQRDSIAARNGGLVYPGYAQLFWRHAWRPICPVVHPASGEPAEPTAAFGHPDSQPAHQATA